MSSKAIEVNFVCSEYTRSMNFTQNSQMLNASIPTIDGVGMKVAVNGGSPGIIVGDKRYSALEMLGKKRNIYQAYSAVAPLFLGSEFPFIPASRDDAVQVQLSSTSSSDSKAAGSTGAHTILMIGYDVSGNQISEFMDLSGNDASAASTNTYRAMYLFMVWDTSANSIMNGDHLGSIYVSPAGDAIGGTSAGVPSDRTRIMATMDIGANGAGGNQGDGLGYCGYSYFPPGTDVYYSNFLFTLADPNNSARIVQVGFITRDFPLTNTAGQVQSGWRTFCSLYTMTDSPSGFTQTAFPSTKTNPNFDTITMMICRRLTTQGGDGILISAYLSGMTATTIT
jgi:hypothetical protein